MYSIQNIVILLVVGAIAGWLAGQIWKKSGFGFPGNVIVGVIGSFVGSYVFGLLGISFHGIIGVIIGAVAGALLLLFLISLIKKS